MEKMLVLGFLLVLLPLSLAQEPECSALGFQGVIPGEDLPRCASSAPQCCSNENISEFESRVLLALRDGLLDEFGESVDEYLEELEDIIMFFREAFSERLIDRFPGGMFIDMTNPDIVSATTYFTDNLIIRRGEEDDDDEDDDDDDDDEDDDKKRQTSFDSDEFVQRIIEASVVGNAEAVGRGNVARRQCVERFLNAQVQDKRERLFPVLARETQRLRQALTTLNRIGSFLNERREALANATFLEQCVSRFVDISFCSRCTNRTAPLCFNGCNALLRACYAPYVSVFNRQYAGLWGLVRSVINTANYSVGTLYRGFRGFLDDDDNDDSTETSYGRRIREACGFDVESSQTKRQVGEEGDSPDDEEDNTDGGEDSTDSEESFDDDDDDIPDGLVGEVLGLKDIIRYGARGLRLCIMSLNLTEDCSSESQTVQYCEGTDVCTARCQCTVGDGRQDDDIDEFLNDDIEGQVDNPVLPLSVDELNVQASALSSDDPVASFLTSDEVTSVLPPEPEENQEEEPSGAGHYYSAMSLSLLLLSLLFGGLTLS